MMKTIMASVNGIQTMLTVLMTRTEENAEAIKGMRVENKQMKAKLASYLSENKLMRMEIDDVKRRVTLLETDMQNTNQTKDGSPPGRALDCLTPSECPWPSHLQVVPLAILP